MSVPRGKSQLPPASLGGSARSTSDSDPGSFQITASALGLEILHVPFKWIHCFLQTFNSPKCLPHWPSKSDLLEDACLPGAGSLARGAQYGPQTCHSLAGLSAVVIILSFVGCLPRDVNIDSATSLLLLSVLLLLLYIFGCRIYFLLAFRPFSSIVAL